jgi:peptide/nickel transport system permease protein
LTAHADAASTAAQIALAPHESLARQTLRRFLRHRLAIVGVIVLIAIALFAIFAPFLLQSPYKTDLRAIDKPPSAEHLLGTDRSGRDVIARIATGARTSLIVGFGAVTIYVIIGTTIGLLAGFLGGSVDQLLMRLTDIVLAIPTLLLIIVFVSVIGPSLISVIAVIGFLGWPATARIVRGQILSLRESEFVSAARVIGLRDSSILRSHLLPNIIGPLTVVATFGVANAILLEAGLSFLGLGVQAPEPSLGNMILDARDGDVLRRLPWIWLPAGILISVTVLAVNFVGDGLRDALDPRSTKRI